jgi:flagellar basal body rod protein FlgG
MNIAFYSGASGLRAYQQGIDIIANNVANVNAYGYKADKASFNNLIKSTMDINKNRTLNEGERVLTGHGVKLSSQDLLYNQGQLHNTGYELDFAIAGDGLFAVERDGRIEYTRNGAFNISIEDDENYLVTADGGYVLDSNQQRITIIYNEETNQIDSGAIAEELGIFTFDNPYGLQKIDNTSFLPTDISGEPRLAADGENKIYTTSLERSNTNIAEEMADLILTQKAYQFSARVVTTADEIEQIVNNLRG